MMKKQIKIMLSAMVAASLAGGAASAAELFPKSGDFSVNQNTDYVTQGKVAGNVSITGSNARPNVSVSDQADHASTETDHGILFADGSHTVSLKDLGTLDINSAKGTDDPVVGIYSAGGAVINVTNVDKVNIGTSDVPFKTSSYALMTLGGNINIGTEEEKVGNVNIFTTESGICAQYGKDSEYSTVINSSGNVTIHGNGAAVQSLALDSRYNAGISINADGKISLEAGKYGAIEAFDQSDPYSGEGAINLMISGKKGVDLSSQSYMGIFMDRSFKNDSNLTITSSDGDVNIEGVNGFYGNAVEGAKNAAKITGQNVNIHSTQNTITMGAGSNLHLAVNQNGGQITLTTDADGGNAVNISGKDSSLTLGDGEHATDVNINGYVNVSGDKSSLTFAEDTTTHVDSKYLTNENQSFITTKGTGKVTFADGAKLDIGNVAAGATLNLINDGGNLEGFTDDTIKTDNVLQEFKLEDGKIVASTVSKEDAAKLLGGSLLTNVALAATGDAKYAAVKALVDGANAKEALDSAAGLAAMANVAHGTYTMNGIFSDAVSGHLMNRQDQDVWAYGFHSKENVNGLSFGADYDAQYNGIAAGADFYKKGGTTAGLALIYADSNVSGSNGFATTKNDADYYGVSLYSRFDRGSYALLGDISYMKGDHDITQVNSGETITASPDSDSISVGVKAVKDYATGENGTLTPYVGLRYLRLSTDDFTASNGLRYEGDDQDLVIVPVGVNYTAAISHGKWSVRPYAGIGYVWTAGDRSADQTVMLGTAADSFSYDTADSGSFIARAGVTTDCGDMSYGIGYSWQKGDSVSNNGWTLSASYHF